MKFYKIWLIWMVTVNVTLAAQPKRLVIDSLGELAAGETESVSLSAEGTLSMGPIINEVATFEASHLWTAAARNRAKEEFYVGSGSEGVLYALSASGESREITRFSETDIYALAVDQRGDAYVATSPKGKVFRVEPNGRTEVYFETGEDYVWDMVWRNDELFIATGPEGKIYRVTDKEQGEVYYDADEPHIRCLTVGVEGELLAGTVGKGLVYHIKDKDKAVALLDSGKSEVRDILVKREEGGEVDARKGDIYVIAIGDGKGNAPIDMTPKGTKKNVINIKAVETISLSTKKTGNSSKTASSTQKATSTKVKGGSVFYVLRREDFFPHVVWKTDKLIHSMVEVKEGVVVNAGDEGYLYHVDHRDVMARWGKLASGQATVMLEGSQGELMVLTSNLAKAYVVKVNGGSEGIYRTQVVDTKLFAQWGAVRAYGEGRWTLRTRSGNTNDPDKSWHEWQALDTDKVASPAARFLQVELRLNSGFVDRFELYYQTKNLAPIIKKVAVLEPNLGYVSMAARAPQLQTTTAKQMLEMKKVATSTNQGRYYPVKEAGLRTVVWEAVDANQDELSYDLEIKNEKDNDWQLLR